MAYSAFATPSAVLSTLDSESTTGLGSLSQTDSVPDLEQDRGSSSSLSSDSVRGMGRPRFDEDDKNSDASSSMGSGSNSNGLRTPPNLHQNTTDPHARWVVQKFGGTSIGKFALRIAEDVIPQYLDQHKVAIVCSARSGSTKALGTTNLLLKAASQVLDRSSRSNGAVSATPGTQTPSWAGGSAGAQTPSWAGSPRPFSSLPPTPGGSSPPLFSSVNGSPSSSTRVTSALPFSETVDVIRREHLAAARSLIGDKKILAELEGEIERDCDGLRAFLFAAQIIDEISPRSKDNIVGVGEKMACKLIAALLRDRGIDAEFVSLENIVPPSLEPTEQGQGGEGSQLGQEFYDRLAIALGERIRACGTKVPVITGFFGPVPGSLLAQIGRGYTDLLAALLSVGLNASELQIWKEVDGIFTADPRKVPTARLIPVISPDEAAELTYYGSEVVHPFVMEQVIRKKIPIRIKNVMNPGGGGTVIHPDPDVVDAAEIGPDLTFRVTNASWSPVNTFAPMTPSSTTPSSPSRLSYSGSSNSISQYNSLPPQSPRLHRSPTAVTIKDHIVVLNVNSNRKSVSHGFLAKIFGTLDRFGVVVDLISTSEVHVSMAIEMPADEGRSKRSVDRLVKELRGSGSVSVHYDMAILSLVGKQMRNMVGIAGRMFATLAEGQVNIEMISQGASEINISCVIEGRDAVKALNLIHQACLSSAALPETGGGRGVGPWLF